MSLANILQSIQRKGQLNKPSPVPAEKRIETSNNGRPQTQSDRPVDPVVARLKAARKAEKEQKERELRAKKGLAAKKELKPRATSQAVKQQKQTQKQTQKQRPDTRSSLPQKEKKPKMSFTQLMKKASSIDQSKMGISITAKTPERLQSPKNPSKRPETGPRTSINDLRIDRGGRRGVAGKTVRKPQNAQSTQEKTRAPIPMRKPSAKLELKLKSRTQENEESDDDLSSFIASDEEQVPNSKYDRDEIWQMFNRKKRSYYERYDDDSDDMEATGAEIWEEEMRSKRNALDEDRREMEEEQRRAEAKLKRKKSQM